MAIIQLPIYRVNSLKKVNKTLAYSKKVRIFAPVKQKNGRVAQLNRVADYGSAGYRFESCRGHTK